MTITISIIIGLIVGLLIGHAGRRQRDRRIRELENEISVNQNVMEAQLSLLADRPLAQQIYRLMSKSIHETA
jgi:uncharacterized membrane-anchored protein YhcB (DUF1043 family)